MSVMIRMKGKNRLFDEEIAPLYWLFKSLTAPFGGVGVSSCSRSAHSVPGTKMRTLPGAPSMGNGNART